MLTGNLGGGEGNLYDFSQEDCLYYMAAYAGYISTSANTL